MRRLLPAICLASLLLVAPAAAVFAEEAQPLPTEKNAIMKVSYDYNVNGRRDPFLSIIKAAEAARSEKPKGIIPIEDYDVSQLRLNAIVWTGEVGYALISLPNGKSYTVTEGMIIGIHGGKIVKIQEESVLVREIKPDYRGNLSPQDTFLRLR